MAITDHVHLSIRATSPGVALPGFGIPLVVSYDAPWADRLRAYTDVSALVDDGFSTDSPTYQMVLAFLSPRTRVQRVIVGRADNTPTVTIEIGPQQVANATEYAVRVYGEGFAAETVTYTSDADATNDEIAQGVRDALNAVVDRNYAAAVTGSAGSEIVELTGNAAGEWFAVEIIDRELLWSASTTLDETPDGIAADLTAIENATTAAFDWYAIYLPIHSDSITPAAAAWAESRTKLLGVDSADTRSVQLASNDVDADDLANLLVTTGYERTFVAWHPRPGEFLAARWAAARLPLTAGTTTWKFAQPSGFAAASLTASERLNLDSRSANWSEEAGGYKIMTPGATSKTADPVQRGWIDRVRGLDSLTAALGGAVFEAFVQNDKIPFTDPGLAIIENKINGVLQRFVDIQFLAPDYQITMPLAADVPAADRAARRLTGVKFSAQEAGAVHEAYITGDISA